MAVIGIDIGGTNFRIGAVNHGGKLEKFEKVPVRTIIRSEDVLGELAVTIRNFSEGVHAEAVAVGFPAAMNEDRSAVIQAPAIPFMENLPVCSVLSEKLGIPVFAERDVTFALLYDMDKYRIGREGITCGIYYGTGIGNAISIDGIPLKGKHGTAGELGHIPVPGSTKACGCGNRGCIEALCGGKALAELQAEHYPDTPIGKMFAEHADDAELISFTDMMAAAAAAEINILDPAHVLIGGGVLKMEGFPQERFLRQIMEKVRKPLPFNELDIIFTDDEKDKCVIGAAAYAERKLGRNTYVGTL